MGHLNNRRWFDKARQDISSAEILLGNGLLSNALFIIEKTVKGALIAERWRLVKTHNLALLAKELENFGENISEFNNALNKFTAAYTEQLYPLSIEFE